MRMNNRTTAKHYWTRPGIGQVPRYVTVGGESIKAAIISIVEKTLEVTFDQMRHKSRKPSYVEARFVAAYLLRRFARIGVTDIGRMFNRDHTSVVYACQKVEDLLEVDERMQLVMTVVCEKLKPMITAPNEKMQNQVLPAQGVQA